MDRIGRAGWRARRLAIVGLLALAGCREELGPEHRETARVVGVVRQNGLPIPHGWVEFLPVEGTIGNLRSAEIRPDGTFATDGVPVGQVSVGIAGAPIGRDLSHLFHPLSSPIRRTIRAGATNTLTIDLLEEWAHLKAIEARGR